MKDIKEDIKDSMTGSEEVTTTVQPEEVRPTPGGKNYRYQCPACTGIAYYSETDQGDSHPVGACINCGSANLGPVEKDRFILLTENEKEALRTQ